MNFENRANLILFDSSLIVGVDYDKELFRHQDSRLEHSNFEHQHSIFEYRDSNLDEEDSNINELNENDFIYNNNTEEIQIRNTEDTEEIQDNHNEEIQNNNMEQEENNNTIEQKENNNNNIEQDENNNNIEQELYINNTGEHNDVSAIEIITKILKLLLMKSNRLKRNSIKKCKKTREIKLPSYYEDFRMNLHVTTINTEEYDLKVSKAIARIMCHFQECNNKSGKKFHQFVQTYILNQGIKKFGKRDTDATYKEVKQLHKRIMFGLVKVQSLTQIERKRAMESLICLTEKRDGQIKARACAKIVVLKNPTFQKKIHRVLHQLSNLFLLPG